MHLKLYFEPMRLTEVKTENCGLCHQTAANETSILVCDRKAITQTFFVIAKPSSNSFRCSERVCGVEKLTVLVRCTIIGTRQRPRLRVLLALHILIIWFLSLEGSCYKYSVSWLDILWNLFLLSLVLRLRKKQGRALGWLEMMSMWSLPRDDTCDKSRPSPQF